MAVKRSFSRTGSPTTQTLRRSSAQEAYFMLFISMISACMCILLLFVEYAFIVDLIGFLYLFIKIFKKLKFPREAYLTEDV